MKKKVLYLLLAASMILSLIGCGAKEVASEPTSEPAAQEPAVVVEEVAEQEPALTVEDLNAMIKEERSKNEPNRDQIKDWCNQAIEMGSGYAMYIMSSECGMDGDYEKSIEFAQKAIDNNNPMGYITLSACYSDGLGVDADINKAIEYANKCIEEGVTYGYALLGNIYTGTYEGIERDEAKMFENYKAYCDSATEDINYSYFEGLAACYQQGMGVEKDREKAIEYYLIAAGNGRPYCYALAASIYMANEDYDNAAPLYGMYAESDADFEQYAAYIDAFLSGGEALYKIGNVEMAKTFWEKSIELGEPHADIAQQKLDSVQ